MERVKHWWDPDPELYDDERLRANALIEETRTIEQRQYSWHELGLWNATLYTNRELVGFRWGEIQAERELWPTNLRTENLIESIGEAMLSKASSSPLKPTPTPHGKSYKVERAVRLLDQFLFGVWQQTEAEDASVQMFRDAFISGLGCVRVSFDSSKKLLAVDPVFFDNVVVDNRECANRQQPRTVRIRTVLPVAAVEAKYGVTLYDTDKYAVELRTVGDGWIPMVEAYRRPDAKGKGGRHTVACGGRLLVDEPWKHEWIPLVFFHWTDRTSGFFCKGGVEQLVPYQVRQNQLNDDIEASQDIACRARMMLHANSMIDFSQWDNEAGRFLLYSGSKPEPMQWPTNLAELYQERERNKAAAFSHMGMSEMFAQADLPQQVRLDSSAGVREFRNMEDGRHLRLWTNFEAARKRLAKTILYVLSTSSGADAFSAVYHPGGSRVSAKTIPFEAVKTLTEDDYSWTMEATPLSSMAPAARRELVRDWSSRQLIDTDEARRMEGNPNLERLEDLEMASIDDVLRHLSILEDGDYEPPTELTNLTYGIKKVTQNYHRLKDYEDVKPAVLENHIRWIVKAVSIQQAAVQPPQPPPSPVAFAPTQGMPGTNAGTVPMGPPQ
jgi:hypothetical protein